MAATIYWVQELSVTLRTKSKTKSKGTISIQNGLGSGLEETLTRDSMTRRKVIFQEITSNCT